MELIFAFAAGVATGVLSGYGVGGGTLLLLYLTTLAGVDQTTAQGINLLYFLPCSAAALFSHIKNSLVDGRAALLGALAGGVCTILGALLATALDTALLHKLFGAFLLCVGVSELFRKEKAQEAQK